MVTSILGRTAARNLALVLVMAISLVACSETETTLSGALLGAGLGAVIGHQSDHAVEGALIGALVGGVAGYLVGRSMRERVATAPETNRSNSYRAVQGLQLKTTDVAVSPSVAEAGDDVDLNATVAVMAPDNGSNVAIRQRIAVYKGDQLVGNILEDNFTVQPGTHRLTRRITLQRDFPAGRYTYVTHIRATQGNEITETSSEAGFSVS